MNTLFEGLGLLIQDNDDARRTLDERVARWQTKSEEELQHEMSVLRRAKAAWLLVSVIAWQAIALTALGHVVAYLFSSDFHLTLGRLVAIVGSWVGILFVVWLVASVFDRYAGFERWFKAFALREKAGQEPIERMERLAELVGRYPEIKAYKDAVLAKRPLYSEDIRLMEEMATQRRNEELLGQIART